MIVKMKNKIIIMFLIILVALSFSNSSKASQQSPGGFWGDDESGASGKYEDFIDQQFEKKYGYSRYFCDNVKKEVEAIYRTMTKNPSKWLESKVPTMTNGWNYGWKNSPCHPAHNGIGNSLVWSKGAACCGHNGEVGGAKDPYSLKIKVFEVTGDEFINDTDSEAVKEEKRRKAGLAFANLYRWQTNEYIPKSLANSIPSGQNINDWLAVYLQTHELKAREAIGNWLAEESTINSSQIADRKKYLYDSNYGTINICGINYNAQSYIASRSSSVACNKEKMEEDSKKGIALKITKKTINGKNYTLIGPYRIDIKRRN